MERRENSAIIDVSRKVFEKKNERILQQHVRVLEPSDKVTNRTQNVQTADARSEQQKIGRLLSFLS